MPAGRCTSDYSACVTMQSVGHMIWLLRFVFKEGGGDYDSIIMLTSHMTSPDSTPIDAGGGCVLCVCEFDEGLPSP